MLACRANFVALSLDRLGSKASLDSLLKSLKKLDNVAQNVEASEDLFFFLYQKARLLKYLYPDKPKRSIPMYESASNVARRCGLIHRFPIAEKWVLWLSREAKMISEEDYLKGLQQCVKLLKQHMEDAWASNTLREVLLEIVHIYRNREKRERAWLTIVRAFEVQVWRFMQSRSPRTYKHFKKIIRMMDELSVKEDLHLLFIQQNREILNELLNKPSYQTLNWKDLRNWLKEEED